MTFAPHWMHVRPPLLAVAVMQRPSFGNDAVVSGRKSPNDEDAVDGKETTSRRHHRSVQKHAIFETVDANGQCVPFDPHCTFWYTMYVMNPPLHRPNFLQKFRRRFRLPYNMFLELVKITKEATDDDGNFYFQRWMTVNAAGIPSSPIELMILGSLHYLGRGWTFDDIEESTGISQEVH